MKIYSMNDEFTVQGSPELVSQRILDALNTAGLSTDQTPDGIEVRAGSDILLRLFGFLLVPNSFPVGLTVHVVSEEEGTRVTSSAYDRLGWYINKKLLWGEDVLNRRLTDLLNTVRTATGQPTLHQGKATFNRPEGMERKPLIPTVKFVGTLLAVSGILSLALVAVAVSQGDWGLGLAVTFLGVSSIVMGLIFRRKSGEAGNE